MRVGIIGMTHQGLVLAPRLAANLAARSVVVYAEPALAQQLSLEKLPLYEEGLQEEWKQFSGRMIITSDLSVVAQCEVVYIAQDLLTHDEWMLVKIRDMIKSVVGLVQPHPIIVIASQVPVGFTRALKGVDHTRVFYQMDTLIYGRAVERLANPQQLVLGAVERPKDGRLPPDLLAVLMALQNSLAGSVKLVLYEEAELAKMAINGYLASQIATTNVLANVAADNHIDWANVATIVQGDSRIGPDAYVHPSLGIGGGHLLRDVQSLSKRYYPANQYFGSVTDAGKVNRDWAMSHLQTTRGFVAIWGLSYKPGTDSVKDSAAVYTIEAINKYLYNNVSVRVYDPVVNATTAVAEMPEVEYFPSPLEAATGANALLIATPWPSLRAVSLVELAQVMGKKLLLDPYRLYDRQEAEAMGFSYRTLGL